MVKISGLIENGKNTKEYTPEWQTRLFWAAADHSPRNITKGIDQEAYELYLYIMNNQEKYACALSEASWDLTDGETEKAVLTLVYITTKASNAYALEHCGPTETGGDIFEKLSRVQCAKYLYDYLLETEPF